MFLFLYSLVVMFLGTVVTSYELLAAGTIIFALSKAVESLEDYTNTFKGDEAGR